MTPERLIDRLRRADIDPADVTLVLNTVSNREGGLWVVVNGIDGREVFRSSSVFAALRFVRRFDALRSAGK